jgi:hypothetical protein
LIGVSDLNKTCVGQNRFYVLQFTYCVHGHIPFEEGGIGEGLPAAVVHRAARNTNQVVKLSVQQNGGCPVPGFRKYWRQKIAFQKFECHVIKNKYPEAASVVQQVHKILNNIEILAGCTTAKVRERSEWTSIVNSAEENGANFCKSIDGKLLLSPLYGMYTVTLNELKAVLKVSAQAGQSDAVKKTSVESTAQHDDFREVKRRMKHSSNDTSQTAKKSTKPVPTSAAVKLSPKAVLTRNFCAPCTITNIDTESTGAENALQ